MGRRLERSDDPYEEHELKVGQVWESMDSRTPGRTVKILKIEDQDCICMSSKGREVRIRKDRFMPTSNGYRLLKDVDK